MKPPIYSDPKVLDAHLFLLKVIAGTIETQAVYLGTTAAHTAPGSVPTDAVVCVVSADVALTLAQTHIEDAINQLLKLRALLAAVRSA